MTSNPEFSRVQPQLLSSSTTTALMLTYRSIILVTLFWPMVILLLPLFITLFRYIQHSVLLLFMTFLLSRMMRNFITKAAPTTEKAVESVEKSNPMIFSFAFGASFSFIRFIVIPLEGNLGLKYILTWTPSLTLPTAGRLACGVFFLGLNIVARYIGPQSVGKLQV